MINKVMLILVLFLVGCTQAQKTEITSIDITKEIEECIYVYGGIQKMINETNYQTTYEFIIDSQEEYQKLIEYKKNKNRCKKLYSLPKINFSKHILLGKVTDSFACDNHIRYKIYKQSTLITHNTLINKSETCFGSPKMYVHWSLIPKQLNKYEIEFITKINPPTEK